MSALLFDFPGLIETEAILRTTEDYIPHFVRGFGESMCFIKSTQLAVADAFSKASPSQRADSTLLEEYLRVELKRFIQALAPS